MMNRYRGMTYSVVSGSVWMFALKVAERLLTFLKLIILARLLFPEDFGRLAIVLMAMNAMTALTEIGTKDALIQKREKIESYLSTALWMNILRALILFVLLYFTAPFLALFFKEAKLTAMLRVISLALIFESLVNPRITCLRRDLKFNQYFFFESIGAIAEACLSIFLAFYLRNVWALVWGVVLRRLVQLIYSYVVYPPPPVFVFLFSKAREIFDFGKHIFVSGVLKFIINNGVDGFIAYLLGLPQLGLYQLGFKISQLPTTEITQHVFQVAFPAYARLQDDRQRLREGYLMILRSVILFAFPMAGLLFILGQEIVLLLLGDKWLPMVSALQVLCLYGLLRSIDYGSVFKAVGQPHIITKITWVRFLAVILIIYPFCAWWGITGAAVSVLVGALSVEGWASLKVCRIIGFPFLRFWLNVFYPFAAASLMVFYAAALKALYPIRGLMGLSIVGILSMAFYLCLITLMNKWGLFPLANIFKRIKEAVKDRTAYSHEEF